MEQIQDSIVMDAQYTNGILDRQGLDQQPFCTTTGTKCSTELEKTFQNNIKGIHDDNEEDHPRS